MLFWLHKSTPKHLVLVVFFHMFFIFSMLCLYNDGESHLSFIINPGKNRRSIEFYIAVETIKEPGASKRGIHNAVQVKKEKVEEIKTCPVIQEKKNSTAPVKKSDSPKNNQEQQKQAKSIESKKNEEKKEAEPIAMRLQEMKSAHRDYEILYEDITKNWTPPSGIPADTMCMVTVVVNREGAVAEMQVNKSSGIFMYDLAARAALNDLKFPRLAWGKSITITFTV